MEVGGAAMARMERPALGPAVVSDLTEAIVGAVKEGLTSTPVNAFLDGRNVTDQILRNQPYVLERYGMH
jgi:hypothetical protein